MSSEALQAWLIVAISIAFLIFALWARVVAAWGSLRRSRALLDPVPYERLAVEIFEFLEQRTQQDLDRGVHPLAGVPDNSDPRLKERLLAEHEERVAAYSAETVHLFNRRFGVRVEYLFGLARAAGYLHVREDRALASRPSDTSEIKGVVQTLKFIAQMINRAPSPVGQRAE